jgi:hypothetical protein
MPRIRWKRAITSVWVKENAWPRCSVPLAVSGGEPIE